MSLTVVMIMMVMMMMVIIIIIIVTTTTTTTTTITIQLYYKNVSRESGSCVPTSGMFGLCLRLRFLKICQVNN